MEEGEVAGRRYLAPAKLNLRLKVTGKRPDGYHELVSIMVPVGLFDELCIAGGPEGEISLACDGDYGLPEDRRNLVYRAAELFLGFLGWRCRVCISLRKRIPVAAGLGGGSSDAASTLMGLNEWFGFPLTDEQLAGLAVRLGADVPFFLLRKPCIARGIGEILQPIVDWPPYWYVIVTPPIQVSTAWVYRNLKLELTIGEYAYILKTLKKKPLELFELLENDLETVTIAHHAIVERAKLELSRNGALGTLMSGSGPSVFGVFESQKHAALAAERLLNNGWAQVFLARGI